MLYAFLCCHDEAVANSWTKEEPAPRSADQEEPAGMTPPIFFSSDVGLPLRPSSLR
jgi:hypothetical protein